MTQLELTVSQTDENPPNIMTRSRWLSSSKQSSEVLLRTYHHKEVTEYKTQCKGIRAESNTVTSI